MSRLEFFPSHILRYWFEMVYVRWGGKNRRACVQEMLNSYRKFVGMKICYWKFEGNLNTHVPLWAQQHMVNRHYSLNLKPWSARTLYVYAHADLAQNTPLVCRKFLPPGCAPRKKIISSRPVRLYDHVLAIVFVSIDPLFTAWNLSHL
jgi:hypothetical protein